MTQQCIAETLSVSPSTIGRELRRNRGLRGYRPGQAHHKALARRRCKAQATKMTPTVIERIEAGLRQQWSPEQIAGQAGGGRRTSIESRAHLPESALHGAEPLITFCFHEFQHAL